MRTFFSISRYVLMPFWFALFFMPHAFANQKCETVLVDKAYQEILYFYFQQDFYQALTQFEVLQQTCPDALKKVSNPGVDPSLLKGGISLAYGLDEQAADIFQRLLNQAAEPKTQVQAWLLLGQSLFQKQRYELAASVLNNISFDSADEYLEQVDKDQWIYLQSQLFHWQNVSSSSAQDAAPLGKDAWLSELSEDSIYRQYVVYNQGLAQLQSGQYEQAVATLQQLGTQQTSFFNELLDGWWSPLQTIDQTEIDALRDRANLTTGYAHLKNQQGIKALEAFDRVRLDSMDTDSAMLGYGWAAAQREEYQTALSAWQRLQKVLRSNEYVMESYLASAYAFEQAFAPTQAIDNLQRGLNRFARESQFLKNSLQQINPAYFLTLAGKPDWSDAIPAHLSEVMLGNEFRNQMFLLQDSIEMHKQFVRWQQRLDTFNLMLDERQQEAVVRAKALQENALLEKLDTYKALRDDLKAKLASAKSQPRILINEQELEWQTRLSRAQQRHSDISIKRKALNQSSLKPSYAKRLKLLDGIMIWNAAEDYAKRSWQAQKSLNEIDLLITKTSAQQGLLEARLNQPPKYDQQRAKIRDLQDALNNKKQRNGALQTQQLQALSQLFEQKLRQQLAQLDSYKLQAQLAIVRLNDKAFRKAQADQQGATQ